MFGVNRLANSPASSQYLLKRYSERAVFQLYSAIWRASGKRQIVLIVLSLLICIVFVDCGFGGGAAELSKGHH